MSSTAVAKTITELKVSAHLMTLDSGLFCVFNNPGAVPPDAATGLPGVRLSAAPAPAGYNGKVGISGFNANGWLGGEDGAALVRVVGGPAQVLVTVYQDPDAQHDAPKLQVIRLTEDAAVVPSPPARDAMPADMPPAANPNVPVEVAAHIYGRGDVGGRLGEWMGERGSKRWIEGFGLAPGNGLAPADLEYQAVLGRGWLSPWAEGGQFCGSRGMSLPILGLRVRLRGAAAEAHSLAVSAVFVDGTEVGPMGDGEACEAPSLAPLEAFRVTLRPLTDAGEPGPAAVARTKPARAKKPALSRPSRQSTPAPTAVVTKAKRKEKVATKPPVPAMPPTAAAKRSPAARR